MPEFCVPVPLIAIPVPKVLRNKHCVAVLQVEVVDESTPGALLATAGVNAIAPAAASIPQAMPIVQRERRWLGALFIVISPSRKAKIRARAFGATPRVV